MFGNYRAVSLLGEGGMGVVYLAEHPGIGRQVAVKVLHAQMGADPQLLSRFLNEARAANSIRHPNIIEVLDSGTTPKGVSYLVMELLVGEALSSRIRRLGRLTEPQAVEIALQTAAGLGAAHAKAIVHRDLKPDNLYLVQDENDPTRERVKILDFGIAKLHTRSADSMKTRTGTLMGTPVYMSPEQCLGTKEVDRRSDIYSLGIILYELLVGRPPFVSEGFGELLNMHLNEAPVPPRQLMPNLTMAVESTILRMLSKKPEDRFKTMEDVRAALFAGANLPHTSTANQGHSSSLGEAHTMLPMAPTQAGVIPSTGTVPPTTRTPVEIAPPIKAGTTIKVRKKSWLPLGIVAVAAVGVITAFLVRGRGTPSTPPPKPADSATAPKVEKPPTPTYVQIQIDSVPQGARIVRVADNVTLGTTPQTLELRASATPIQVRLDKEGFVSNLQEITLTQNARFAPALEAIPVVPTTAPTVGSGSTKKPGKGPKSPRVDTEPRVEEPAKL